MTPRKKKPAAKVKRLTAEQLRGLQHVRALVSVELDNGECGGLAAAKEAT